MVDRMKETGTDPVGRAEGPGPVSLLGRMSLFVLLGAPLVFLVWRFLNEALAGEFRVESAGLAAGGLLGLIGLLAILVRQIRDWEEKG